MRAHIHAARRRPKLLALLVDLVPADELGDAVEELELMD